MPGGSLIYCLSCKRSAPIHYHISGALSSARTPPGPGHAEERRTAGVGEKVTGGGSVRRGQWS